MAMMAEPGLRRLRQLDETITSQKTRPGIVRRILPHARRYRWPASCWSWPPSWTRS